ncbi:hypothetical protein NKW45_05610 [Acetobacter orientalis]|uniref:glycine-rich domain-containing protein n=1 Tax=Acetobacter orientalis TaxID=146474 RepID=UPI0020A3052B|nr:hypothetical protein [Acetobacter orientalis]MCP1221322.1 hypothetical protein [Acetobacter orientalis]
MVYRIDDVTAVSSLPPVPSDNIGQPGFFTGGSTAGQSATRVRFWWLNMVQEELVAFAKAAGLEIDKANNGQALAGARILFAAAERGVAPYSTTLAKLLGGYPKYAVVVDANGAFWVSQSDGNMTVPGADGANWVLFFDGYAKSDALKSLRPLSQIIQPVVFSSGGTYTYTVPANVYGIRVKCWGGSGGGGGSAGNGSSGAGGASGAYSEGIYTVVPGQELQVVVGSGGSGGASGGDGTGGTTSSVQGCCTSTGGSWGAGATNGISPGYGYGGTANGGNIWNVGGQNGQTAQIYRGGLGGASFGCVQDPAAFASMTSQVIDGLISWPLGGGQGGYGPGGKGARGSDGYVIVEGL